MFADNLTLFCAAEIKSVQSLMRAFQTFSETTGLIANHSKSKLVIRGCKPQTEQMIIQATKFSEGSFPIRYLGIPITASRLSKMECRSLVEKITARIKSWSTRNLSYTGRAALIHVVLIGIYIFWARILILPQGIVKQVNAMCRNFLWGADNIYKKTPYIARQEVCLPK